MIGRHIIFVRTPIWDQLGNNAVKSSLGFWYCGNIYNQNDIAYGVAQNGSVESDETAVLIPIMRSLMPAEGQFVFYDIGANTGYYGILVRFANKDAGVVHFFEPLPEHTKCIENSLYLNRLENGAFIHQYGLSDKSGKEKFFVSGSGSTLHQGFLDNELPHSITIQLEDLDSTIKKEHMAPAHLIKIDVEGHEYNVLKGADGLIKEHCPALFIEIIHRVASKEYRNENYDKTFDLLADRGYKTFIVFSGKLMSYDKKTQQEGIHMFLFLHKDKHVTVIKNLNANNS